ncbi:hypothetical protein OAU50_02510 [Planctomycetota bacterium]|nr:hypothetical protein [Planctomycetota bacterium]
MRLKALIFLAGLCIGSAMIGCGRSDSNTADDNKPASKAEAAPIPQPPLPTSQPPERIGPTPWEDWMHHSPIRENMRRFWVDMGQIVANSARPELVDGMGVELLDSAAADIERRAERIAGYWKAVRDRASASVLKARAGDWPAAYDDLDEMHHECGNCHHEYWTQAARGYLPETLKGWHENGTPFEYEPWGEQVFSAPPKVRARMDKLRTDMNASFAAIDAKDLTAYDRTVKAIYDTSNKQYKIFNDIALNAAQIQNAANVGDLGGVEKYYNRIATKCITCHAETADGRALNPLPWTAARDE